MAANRFLVWGGEGWIANQLKVLLQSQGKEVHTTTIRMENREAVLAELDRVKPTHVLNCAGCTGRPNVDWCENNKEATVRSNVVGTLNLTDACFTKGIHITVYATGCIYEYDDAHPQEDGGTVATRNGPGFKETDKANFAGSFYSRTKAHVEEVMKFYTNCLILRLRMPVSDELHSRNFVTKIARYAEVTNVPNSNTLLYDLLPASVVLAEHNETGVYNFTNPGAISHKEVLELFDSVVAPAIKKAIAAGGREIPDHKDLLKPKRLYITAQDAADKQLTKAGRSNCKLDTTKLETKLKEYGIEIPRVDEAYNQCFERMAVIEAKKVAA